MIYAGGHRSDGRDIAGIDQHDGLTPCRAGLRHDDFIVGIISPLDYQNLPASEGTCGVRQFPPGIGWAGPVVGIVATGGDVAQVIGRGCSIRDVRVCAVYRGRVSGVSSNAETITGVWL